VTTRAQAPAQEQQAPRLTKNRWSLAVLGLVVLGVLMRLPTIGYGLNEPMAFFPFRQTQTAVIIREYMQNGLSLSSPLSVLGPPWDAPMEFPLYQLLAAQVGLTMGWSVDLAARVTCLIFFEVTAILVAVLARRWFSPVTALIALGLFQVLPLGYVYGSASVIEFLPTAAFLGGILAMDVWVGRRAEPRSRHWLLFVASVLLAIGFLVKITTGLPWAIVYLAALIAWSPITVHGRVTWQALWRANRSRLPGLIPLGIGAVAGLAWTRYADSVKVKSFYTEFLVSSNMTWWNFGTWEQRLRTQNWAAPVEWSGSITGPGLLLFMIALAAILLWPKRRPITLALALAFPISVAVFFNLYVVHNYYLSAVYPALVLIAAAAIVGAARLASTRSTQAIVGGALCFVLLAAAWLSPQGQLISQRTKDAPFNYSQSVEITQHTAPDDGVILVGCGWSSEILYFADRRGLMVQNVWPPFTDTRLIPYSWLGTDLDYVYLCDPSTANLTPLFPPEVSLEPVTANLLRIVP
jgi:hypothetical protein